MKLSAVALCLSATILATSCRVAKVAPVSSVKEAPPDASSLADRLTKIATVSKDEKYGEILGDGAPQVFAAAMLGREGKCTETSVRPLRIPEYVNGIGNTNEAVNGGVRNKQITTEYARLAFALHRLLDCPARMRSGNRGVPFEANWFHFGIWASRAAGELMKSTDPAIKRMEIGMAGASALIPRKLNNQSTAVVMEFVLRELGWHQDAEWNKLQKKYETWKEKPIQAIQKAFVEYTQAQLARGNWAIARDIMPSAWKFIAIQSETCSDPANADVKDVPAPSTALKAYLDELWGEAFPAELTASDLSSVFSTAQDWAAKFTRGDATWSGQFRKALAVAFYSYHRAMYERIANRRSEHLHLGNVFIGMHEQMLVQDYLNRALGVLNGRKPKTNPLTPLMHAVIMQAAFPTHANPTVDCRRGPIATNLTSFRLSSNLDYRTHSKVPGGGADHLYTLDVSPADAFLSDKTLGARRSSKNLQFPGVADWTDYPKRMKYLAGLFRTLHYSNALEGVPYQEQCAAASEFECIQCPSKDKAASQTAQRDPVERSGATGDGAALTGKPGLGLADGDDVRDPDRPAKDGAPGASGASGPSGSSGPSGTAALEPDPTDEVSELPAEAAVEENLFPEFGDDADALGDDVQKPILEKLSADKCLFTDPVPKECGEPNPEAQSFDIETLLNALDGTAAVSGGAKGE